MKKIIFWSMAAHGDGISGGDRIFMEFAKRWSKNHPVKIVTWAEGESMMARNNLFESARISFHRLTVPKIIQSNFLFCYLYRIVISIITSLTLRLDYPQELYLYSSSEFWMDSIPSLILKLRYPKISWVATWYQTAPNPLMGFSNGRYRSAALMLWLSQLPIRPLISNFANYVLVNNDLEKKIFPNSSTIVVLGAVNTQKIKKMPKAYDSVFQGRFHPQKGVVELIQIWNSVVKVLPSAKLAMIGDGPLMKEVEFEIRNLKLEKNVKLFGYVFDGDQKCKILNSSKIVVHPALYDSGGMASAEAMAFNLPCIGFDLPAYESYYPKGMVKVPVGDLNLFAEAILNLLKNSSKRSLIGNQAGKFIRESYSWDFRAQEILRQIAEKTNQERKRAKFQ